MCKNSIFFATLKGPIPPQSLEEGLRSEPYLLVSIIMASPFKDEQYLKDPERVILAIYEKN